VTSYTFTELFIYVFTMLVHVLVFIVSTSYRLKYLFNIMIERLVEK